MFHSNIEHDADTAKQCDTGEPIIPDCSLPPANEVAGR